MKQLQLIYVVLFLLFAQWGNLDHAYHDHKAGEVCDYCLTAQPLEHSIATSILPEALAVTVNWQVEPVNAFISKSHIRYYAVRAPPRFI